VNGRTSHEPEEAQRWKSIVAPYHRPSHKRALWQLTNTFGPYAALWVAMYHTLDVSLWLTALLAILASGLLVRIFIIFHDCAHGSYFGSRRANVIVGRIAGVLTFTPYAHWRWEHSVHHASAGDLDRRGIGDVWTMTAQEYLAAPRGRRLAYRLARNPFILFVIAPLFVFIVQQRFASAGAQLRQRRSVWMTNAALLCMVAAGAWTFGIASYVLMQSIVIAVAGTAGIWLFYVQHQFEDVRWERSERWDAVTAALQGSSFYKLPRILQWFSGNIGFHHIHHLSPRVPNYNLQRCHESNRVFEQIKPVTLRSSLRCLTFRFWDEQSRKLVGYAHLRQLEKHRAHARPENRSTVRNPHSPAPAETE
jgi:acyl-lipid omega-6 desaturase (Delta-12 desaturase)